MSSNDPLRELIELQQSIEEARSTALNEQGTAAAETAQAILDADPALGPIDVVHIAPDQDIPDQRYLIVLFQGEKGFLFDRTVGSTTIVELDDRGIAGEERLIAKLENAKAAARKAKLAKVYVVKHC